MVRRIINVISWNDDEPVAVSAVAEAIGDFVELVSDGTSWFVHGMFENNGGITQGST